MVNYNWKYVGETPYAKVFVDTKKRKTKVVTTKWIYLHNGIYPFHDYDATRRYKR